MTICSSWTSAATGFAALFSAAPTAAILDMSSIAYNGGSGGLLSLMLGADGFVSVSNTNAIFKVVSSVNLSPSTQFGFPHLSPCSPPSLFCCSSDGLPLEHGRRKG